MFVLLQNKALGSLAAAILALHTSVLAFTGDVVRVMLSLHLLPTFVGAFDLFKLAVAREMEKYLAHPIVPTTAFVFVDTIDLKIFNSALDLFVFKCFERTRARAFGVRTGSSVRRFCLIL